MDGRPGVFLHGRFRAGLRILGGRCGFGNGKRRIFGFERRKRDSRRKALFLQKDRMRQKRRIFSERAFLYRLTRLLRFTCSAKAAEQRVEGADQCARRTIVGRKRRIFRRQIFFKFSEYGHIGAAEQINGLLFISYKKQFAGTQLIGTRRRRIGSFNFFGK